MIESVNKHKFKKTNGVKHWPIIKIYDYTRSTIDIWKPWSSMRTNDTLLYGCMARDDVDRISCRKYS